MHTILVCSRRTNRFSTAQKGVDVMTYIIAQYTHIRIHYYGYIVYLHPEIGSVILLLLLFLLILLSIVYGTENETSLVSIRARTA